MSDPPKAQPAPLKLLRSEREAIDAIARLIGKAAAERFKKQSGAEKQMGEKRLEGAGI